MDSNLGDTVASTLQPRNRLENRESENDEMLRGVWKAVETSTGEVSIGETKEAKSKKTYIIVKAFLCFSYIIFSRISFSFFIVSKLKTVDLIFLLFFFYFIFYFIRVV